MIKINMEFAAAAVDVSLLLMFASIVTWQVQGTAELYC